MVKAPKRDRALYMRQRRASARADNGKTPAPQSTLIRKERGELLYTVVCRSCGRSFETAIHEFESRCPCGTVQRVKW